MNRRIDLDLLRHALIGLKIRRAEIDNDMAAIERRIADRTPGRQKKPRRMSAAGRRRIAEAQKRRWARVHAEQGK